MRNVANSVAVVTTNGPAGQHGATVSAFSSVSADPPTTLVCLRMESRIARAVMQNKVFCVNVLPQSGQRIAERFAGRDDDQCNNRFDGIDCHGAPGSAPILSGATAFYCTVEQVVTSGSHQIFIGNVVDLQEGGSAPLTYVSGAYHRIASQNTTSDEALI